VNVIEYSSESDHMLQEAGAKSRLAYCLKKLSHTATKSDWVLRCVAGDGFQSHIHMYMYIMYVCIYIYVCMYIYISIHIICIYVKCVRIQINICVYM